MQFKSLFVALAAGLSVASAYETVSVDETTTSTSTLYKTVTVTQCNPSISACPGYEASTSTTLSSAVQSSYPVYNSTSAVVYPTGGYSNHTSSIYYSKPTASGPGGYPIGTPAPSGTQPVSPPASSIAQGAAGSLVVQSGLLLSILGAGMAILA